VGISNAGRGRRGQAEDGSIVPSPGGNAAASLLRQVLDRTGADNERFRDNDIFRRVFERVVEACISAGLVGGKEFAVGCEPGIAREPLRLDSEALLCPLKHRLRRADLRLADGARRFDIHDDANLHIDQIII